MAKSSVLYSVTHKVPQFLDICIGCGLHPSHSLATPIVTFLGLAQEVGVSGKRGAIGRVREDETALYHG